MMKREKIKREKMLDPSIVKDPDKMLNQDLVKKLREYRIGDGDYKLKMGKYHTEGREGVPYCMLIIKKALSTDEQVNLEMDIRALNASFCVIFKK